MIGALALSRPTSGRTGPRDRAPLTFLSRHRTLPPLHAAVLSIQRLRRLETREQPGIMDGHDPDDLARHGGFGCYRVADRTDPTQTTARIGSGLSDLRASGFGTA